MQPPKKSKSRIDLIDAARGLALIAMAIYHFAWDLEFFGYAPPGMTAEGGWRLFARAIASSFLFLVGFSLFLAHYRGIRWRPYWIRMAQVAGAAIAITVATYFATPDAYIFFGILHHIALASLLGLAFLHLPGALTLVLAVIVIALPNVWRSELFNGIELAWVGLAAQNPRSNDFVPLFPFFGAVLMGIASAQFAVARDWTSSWARIELGRGWGPLLFAGRHSLAFYLIHQPVLIATLFVFSQFAPAPTEPASTSFIGACQSQCRATRDEEFCIQYCSCVSGQIEAEGRLDELFTAAPTPETSAWLEELAAQCTVVTDQQTIQRQEGND